MRKTAYQLCVPVRNSGGWGAGPPQRAARHNPMMPADLSSPARNPRSLRRALPWVALVALIAVASAALSKLGIGRKAPADVVDPGSLGAWEELGLGQQDVPDVIALCAEEAERARAMVE